MMDKFVTGMNGVAAAASSVDHLSVWWEVEIVSVSIRKSMSKESATACDGRAHMEA